MSEWTENEKARVIRLRFSMQVREIAEIFPHHTETAIAMMLSREAKKRNIDYPKLRRSNLKWDKEIVAQWRKLTHEMPRKAIAELYHVHPAKISAKFAADLHGELRF